VLEVGWRGQPARDASLSATAFHARYDRLRTQEIAPSGTFVEFANGMQGRVAGIEAWGAWERRAGWRLSAGFTRLWQHLRLRPGSNDARAVAVAEGANPARQALLRASFDIGPRVDLDVTARHVSALSRPAVPAYTAIDLRCAWQLRDDVEVALAAQNLLDPGHGEFTDVATRSELGRAVSIELTARFR
jgi:iron complex outermembrane recepter protein